MYFERRHCNLCEWLFLVWQFVLLTFITIINHIPLHGFTRLPVGNNVGTFTLGDHDRCKGYDTQRRGIITTTLWSDSIAPTIKCYCGSTDKDETIYIAFTMQLHTWHTRNRLYLVMDHKTCHHITFCHCIYRNARKGNYTTFSIIITI